MINLELSAQENWIILINKADGLTSMVWYQLLFVIHRVNHCIQVHINTILIHIIQILHPIVMPNKIKINVSLAGSITGWTNVMWCQIQKQREIFLKGKTCLMSNIKASRSAKNLKSAVVVSGCAIRLFVPKKLRQFFSIKWWWK